LKPFQIFWLYSEITFQKWDLHSLFNILGVCQHCIVFAVLLVYSQVSMNTEISNTIHILQDIFYRRFGSDTEILTLNILSRNLNDRTSSMYTIDYPLMSTVSKKYIFISWINVFFFNFLDVGHCHRLLHCSRPISSLQIN
jgi:hypothetical protein